MRFTDLKETVNHDVLNPAFNDTQFFDGLTYRASSEEDHQGKPYFVIKVFDDNFVRVGLVKFGLQKDDKGGEWLESLISAIQPEYQGKGIASNIYAYARMLGNTIKPSSDQTAMGRAMWSGWEKSGAAKHLTSNESKFTDYELAVMEGGHSLDKPKSALRQVVEAKEEFNQELLKPGFEFSQKINGVTYKVTGGKNGVSVEAFDPYKKNIGRVAFGYYRPHSALISLNTYVAHEWQGKGIASTMYAVVRMLGAKIKPSNLQTSDGQDMWAKWEKNGDAEYLKNLNPKIKKQDVDENFADGKVKGKSRPGRVKRSGASCDGSVSDLRSKAKNASGERAKMYHWCANMKSGRTNESEILDDLEEGWKDWVAGAALGAAALSPQAADAKVSPQQKPAITQQVQGNAEYATKLVLKPEAKVLIRTAQAAGIKGKELAQFVAQCAHETANFSSLKEFGGRADFKKYDPKHNPRKAKMLGNKQVGDGAKYHGRGYIQLTGRDNYKRAGQALGLPLEEQPELVERPDIAAKVAVWFWQNQVAPKVSNFNDTESVTKPINSGLKGLEDRHNKFASIMALMGSKS